MKKLFFLLISLCVASYAFAQETRTDLAKKSEVVLRVKCVKEADACEKYCWQEVKILKVIKNENKYSFNETLRVAYYNWAKGIPLGESTIYLEKYNSAKSDLWKLLGGGAETGVSHYKNEKK